MKRFFISIFGIAFLFGSVAFAINPSETVKDKAPTAKPAILKQPAATKPPPRETRMRATGIVKELTTDTLRIERTVTAEIMEFYLEKPLDKIKAGDKVTVSYSQKEEKNMAVRVNKALPKKKGISSQDKGSVLLQPAPSAK